MCYCTDLWEEPQQSFRASFLTPVVYRWAAPGTSHQGPGSWRSAALCQLTWWESSSSHQPCRLWGWEHTGLGGGAWDATGHRCTHTREMYGFNTSTLSLRSWMMNPHVLWYSWPLSRFSHSCHISSQRPLWFFFHSYTPASCSLCLNLPLLLKAEWVQSSHNQRSPQQWCQRQPCLIVLSPYKGPTPTAPTEEQEKMKHKPIRDIQETFRENKCLTCLFSRQKSNVGFSEVYKVAKWVDYNGVSKSTSLRPRAASAWVPTLRHGSQKPVWMFHHEGNNAFFFSLFWETAMPLKQKCENKWTKQIQLEADTQHGELQARWLVWQS